MKKSIPALNEEGPLRRLSNQADPLVVLERRTQSGDDRAFILVNTQEQEQEQRNQSDRNRRIVCRCGGVRGAGLAGGFDIGPSVPSGSIRIGDPRTGYRSRRCIPSSMADAIPSSGLSASCSKCGLTCFATGTTSRAPS